MKILGWGVGLFGMGLLVVVGVLGIQRLETSGWLLFVSDRDSDGFFELYRINGDGSSMQPINPKAYDPLSPRWSLDGQWISFSTISGDVAVDYQMRFDGSKLQEVSMDNDAVYRES